MIRAVLFDFDGTLTAPHALDFSAMRQAIGCPPDEDILRYTDSLKPAQRRKAEQTLTEFELSAASNSRPNDGAEELLATLRDTRIPFGILTRNRRLAVDHALSHFTAVGVADFACILSRDDAIRDKPHPEGVRLAAERMCVSCAQLVMVGDYTFDIEAGHAAGAQTAFLPPTPNAQTRVPPTYRLTSLLDLPCLCAP